jgi:general L-amino acid transport system permease protein
MAIAADVPKDGFRLSQLIYDTRYRSYTIQIIVLLLFGLAVWWLLDNVVENLAVKGKVFSFAFLWQRAGYDIEQTLIPYTNDSNHFRAWMVGLANTLAVAIPGCILATILGAIIGVLRLSKNWLIGRLTTVYVEIFRNIPLLLWILIVLVPMREIAPEPKDFKITQEMIDTGTEPANSKFLFNTVAVTARGVNVPFPIFYCSQVAMVTAADGSVAPDPAGAVSEVCPVRVIGLGPLKPSQIFLTLLAVLAACVFVQRRVVQQARVVQEATGVRPVTWWKSLLILFAPVILLIMLFGMHLEIPAFPVNESGVSTGFNFQGGLQLQHAYSALLIALVLYTSAFVAEIVRAGIQAISRGQSEAASALGLRPSRTMNLVILPQALRVIIPPMISQYLNLTKNTSLGIAVSYLDLRGTLGGITLNQTGRELECMLLMMANYLILSLLISSVANIYNRSIQLKER